MERIRKEVTLRRQVGITELPPRAPACRYELGTVLKFGQGGNASDHTRLGWSHPEDGFTWSDGPATELFFTFDRPPGDLVLSFRARPLLHAGIAAQQVSAKWNGAVVGVWNIQDAGEYFTLILSHLTESSESGVLRFHIPQAFSPISKGLGADSRSLGLAFNELILRPASELGFK